MEKPFQIINTASVQAGSEMLSLRRFVKMSSGKLAYCGANQKAIGVLAAETAQGEMAPVFTHGIVVLEVGSGGVTENGYVTSDANGKAVAVANLTVTVPEGATPVTSAAATPTLVVAGGTLPVKVNGVALDTVSEGGTVRVILQ